MVYPDQGYSQQLTSKSMPLGLAPRGCDRRFKIAELLPERRRQAVTKLSEMIVQQGHLPVPIFHVDSEQRFEVSPSPATACAR